MLAELRGWTPFVGMQIEYSLIERTSERELLPMARELDIGVMAWSVLANGILTGKYNKQAQGQETSGARRLDKAQFADLSERNLAIADTVQQVAQTLGRTPSQVAINWVRSKGIIPILGATKVPQIQDNLDCLEFELTEEHLQTLDDVSKIQLGFPHEFLARTKEPTYGGMFDAIDNHRSSRGIFI